MIRKHGQAYEIRRKSRYVIASVQHECAYLSLYDSRNIRFKAVSSIHSHSTFDSFYPHKIVFDKANGKENKYIDATTAKPMSR